VAVATRSGFKKELAREFYTAGTLVAATPKPLDRLWPMSSSYFRRRSTTIVVRVLGHREGAYVASF
jgi:hypothetical protein